MKIITLFILLATLTCNDLLAQIRLDVDGDGWIRKRLVMGNTDDKNMFIGHDAGINTTPRDPNPIQNGIENTFIGYQSGFKNTSGSYNTYLGVLAGSFNTTGSSNTFIGLRAGFSNTSGAANTFLGQSSGRSNTIGDFNTFIGTFAGGNNMSGTINTFIGYNSGGNNTIGKRNTFIGNWAGFNNNKGNRNTSIGSSSGSNNINGNYNTFLGWDANLLYSIDSLDRAIAIGYRAEVACHNCAVIGGTGLNAVKMGVATNMPLSDLHIKQSTDQLQVGGGIRLEDTADGDYWAVTIDQLNDYNFVFNGSVIGWIDSGTRMYIPNTSAFSEPNESTSRGRRSKKMQKVLKKVQQLQPLTQKIAGDNASEIWGFHSEEVAKLFPAITSEKNGQKGVIYNYFGVLSIKAIQELAVVVEKQQTQITHRDEQIEQLTTDVAELKEMLQTLIADQKTKNTQSAIIQSAKLGQNAPNPFEGNTKIPYTIPNNVQKATILIHNINGQLIESIAIQQFGEGALELQTTNLSNGQYTYSLEVDGLIIDTKKMNLVR